MDDGNWPSQKFRDRVVKKLSDIWKPHEIEIGIRRRSARNRFAFDDVRKVENYAFEKCCSKDDYMRTIAKTFTELNGNGHKKPPVVCASTSPKQKTSTAPTTIDIVNEPRQEALDAHVANILPASDNNVPAKILPGVENCIGFCVHPNGSVAFLFNDIESSFVRVDLATGQQTLLVTEKPRMFSTGKRWSWHTAASQNQLSDLFIYSFFEEVGAKVSYIVSFRFDNDRFFIADEFKTGIYRNQDTASFNFQKVDNRQIFFWSYQWKESNTIVDAAQFDISESGMISLNVVQSQKILSGSWGDPFIHGGFFYFLSLNNGTFFKQLIKVPLANNGITEEFCIINDILYPNYLTRCTQMQVIGQHIFFYVYSDECKLGSLLHIDLEEKCVENTYLSIYGNVQASKTDNGFLYLHGNCTDEQTHIFGIEVAKHMTKVHQIRWSTRKDRKKKCVGLRGALSCRFELPRNLSQRKWYAWNRMSFPLTIMKQIETGNISIKKIFHPDKAPQKTPYFSTFSPEIKNYSTKYTQIKQTTSK